MHNQEILFDDLEQEGVMEEESAIEEPRINKEGQNGQWNWSLSQWLIDFQRFGQR